MKNKEFKLTFQITRKIIFEVKYYTLGSNKNPYFSTSSAEFNQPKSDFKQCGQCQDELLKGHSIAKLFYKKWDKKHLSDLTTKEYEELIIDLELLKEKYNYIESDSFYLQRELSKMKILKK